VVEEGNNTVVVVGSTVVGNTGHHTSSFVVQICRKHVGQHHNSMERASCIQQQLVVQLG
jgi:hypothetical protein